MHDAPTKHRPLHNEYKRAIKRIKLLVSATKVSPIAGQIMGGVSGVASSRGAGDVISAMMDSRRWPRTTRRNYPGPNEPLSNVLYRTEYFTVIATPRVITEPHLQGVNAAGCPQVHKRGIHGHPLSTCVCGVEAQS